MMGLLRKAGDTVLKAVMPEVIAKACGWHYLGTCYIGSGTYAQPCDQWWNSCNGADEYDLFTPWGTYVGTYPGVCPCW